MLELALPWTHCMGRSQSEGRWSSIGNPGVLRGWRMLRETSNPAKVVLFILQQKLGVWKDGIFQLNPSLKIQMLRLLET